MTTTITINRAVVEQAYEAFWYYHATEFGRDTPAGKAIAALGAALAEPQEPAPAPAPMPLFPPVYLWKRGCAVCGIGAGGHAYGYVCPRSDCPTRVTCGGTV
jgi:hypothetical protein